MEFAQLKVQQKQQEDMISRYSVILFVSFAVTDASVSSVTATVGHTSINRGSTIISNLTTAETGLLRMPIASKGRRRPILFNRPSHQTYRFRCASTRQQPSDVPLHGDDIADQGLVF